MKVTRISILAVVWVLSVNDPRLAMACDCNLNQVEDSLDIADGTSADCNANGVPDECDVLGGAFHFEAGASAPVPPPDVAPGINMATGDVDGDLDIDLVVGRDDGNDIALLFNAGDGTFPIAQNVSVDANPDARPRNVALGDLDGDLDLDLVVASLNSDVSVLLNDGTGNFSPPTIVTVDPFPWQLALGDVDGDGDVDFTVTIRDGVGVFDGAVYLNQGAGTFAFGSYYSTGRAIYAPVLADLDGDLDLDIALLDFDNMQLAVILGQGNGQFGPPQDLTLPNREQYLTAADLDGDLDVDLAASSGRLVTVLSNQGNGVFIETQTLSFDLLIINVASADLDGDLDVDLIAAHQPETDPDEVIVLLNDGSGMMFCASSFVTGTGINFVIASDLDGDSRPDAATGGGSAVGVLLNRRSPPTSEDRDANGIPDECNGPPDCSGAVASVAGCWPPNHMFHPVEILGVTDPDGNAVTITITAVSQDEPVQETGAGRCPDAVLVDADGDGNPESAAVRCERAGNPRTPGNGRVYAIHFMASDELGASCEGTATFCVPHDQRTGSRCIDDGQSYDSLTCPGGGGGGAAARVHSLR